MTITTILTDIEGTTTDIKFVHNVLFPYARKMLPEFIRTHQQDSLVKEQIKEIQQLIHLPEAELETIIQQLIDWIDEDKKITPLKALQGLVWTSGYQAGDFQGHVYPDVPTQLKAWFQSNISLNVFSSGSIKAQKLLFSHTPFGDLTPLFSHYFDTTTGPKKEANSYQLIAKRLKVSPNEILFLSDVIEELDAAAEGGLNTCLLQREPGSATHKTQKHPCVSSFSEIHLSELTLDKTL